MLFLRSSTNFTDLNHATTEGAYPFCFSNNLFAYIYLPSSSNSIGFVAVITENWPCVVYNV